MHIRLQLVEVLLLVAFGRSARARVPVREARFSLDLNIVKGRMFRTPGRKRWLAPNTTKVQWSLAFLFRFS